MTLSMESRVLPNSRLMRKSAISVDRYEEVLAVGAASLLMHSCICSGQRNAGVEGFVDFPGMAV